MGPTDDARNGEIKKFRARETSNRKRRPGFEFRDHSAVGKQRSRRIRQSAGESGQPRRGIARRARKRGSLRREDQLRVKLGGVLQRPRKRSGSHSPILWISPRCRRACATRSALVSGQTCLGQIKIALNPAQGVVVNHMLIAQTDDGLTFDVESLLLKALVLGRGNSAAAIFVALGAEFELCKPIIVLCAQTACRIRRKIAIVCQALDQTERGFVSLDACFAFFFVDRTVVFDPKLPDQDRQRKTLKDQSDQNDAKGEKQNVVTTGKRVAVRQNKRQRKRRSQ